MTNHRRREERTMRLPERLAMTITGERGRDS
jgi:hypothetical protein